MRALIALNTHEPDRGLLDVMKSIHTETCSDEMEKEYFCVSTFVIWSIMNRSMTIGEGLDASKVGRCMDG